MLTNLFRRAGDPHMLVVGMTGVKLGDRFIQIGCANGGRLAAVAQRVGLSGHAVAVVPDEASAARATKGAAQAGVLVEVETASPSQVPAGDAAFDVAVIDDTGGVLSGMSAADCAATIREALRILRPGGRLMVIGSGTPTSFARRLLGPRREPSVDAAPALLANGFKSVRTLAEREGLVFVEGIKPRQA